MFNNQNQQFNNQFNNQFGQQQQLPFSQDKTTTPFVSGLPDYPSSWPAININPEMMNYQKAVIGYSMFEVQNNANKNNMRVFTYNVLSSNGWNNSDFAALVNNVADYAMMIMYTQNSNVQQAIATAATQIATWTTALICSNFVNRGLSLNHNALNDIQVNINQFDTVLRSIQNFQQQLQFNRNSQYQQQNGYGQQMNQGGYNQPIRNMQQQTFNPTAQGVSPNNGGMFNNGMNIPATNNNSDVGFGASMGSGEIHVPVHTQQPQQNIVANDVNEITFIPDAKSIMVGSVIEESKQLGNLVLMDKKCMINRNWLETRPFSIVFDKDKHVLFIERDSSLSNGVEVIKSVEDVGMDYLNHELDDRLALKSFNELLSPSRTIQKNWDNVSDIKHSSVIEGTENRDVSIPLNGNVLISDKFTALTIEQAIHDVKADLNNKKLKLSKNSILTFKYRKVIPFYIDPQFGDNILELKDNLAAANTFSEIRLLLDSSISDIPEDVWHYLNKKFADLVNYELSNSLGINTATIDGFHEDINKLLKYINDKGEGVLKTFLSSQKKIISNGVKNIKGDALKTYLTLNHSDVVEGYDSRHLIFFEDHLIVMVPWLSSKLNMIMLEKSGVVMESYLPEFYKACKTIIDMSKELKVSHRSIMTKDGVCITINEPSIGTNECYVISKIQ